MPRFLRLLDYWPSAEKYLFLYFLGQLDNWTMSVECQALKKSVCIFFGKLDTWTMSVEFQVMKKYICIFLGELDNWTLGPCQLNTKL